MKKLLLLFVVMMLVMSVFTFTACTDNSTTSTDTSDDVATDTAGDATGDTSWADIEAKGYFVIGTIDAYAPMAFLDASNNNVGFDIDLANAVAEYLGVDVQLHIMDWDSKMVLLNNKDIDVIWGGMSVTEERKKQVVFTDAYLNNLQVIVTAADSDINSKADLAGHILAWQMGSSADNAIKNDPIYAEISEERTYNSMAEAFMDLANGRVDAVVLDSIYFNYYATESGTADQYKVLDDNFGTEDIAVGCRLGDVTLSEKLNEALNVVKASDEGKAIAEKWFGYNVFEQ